MRCIESALTGESEAVTKQPATLEQSDIPLGDGENMEFMATSVAAGSLVHFSVPPVNSSTAKNAAVRKT